MDFASLSLNDAQHLCQSHCGFASLQLHDKAHADPGRRSQLRLRERELFAGGADGIAQLLG